MNTYGTAARSVNTPFLYSSHARFVSRKPAAEITEKLGIYEFYEFSEEQPYDMGLIRGAIDIRFKIKADDVEVRLLGMVLGEREHSEEGFTFGVRFLPGTCLYMDQTSVQEMVHDRRSGELTEFAKHLLMTRELYMRSSVFVQYYSKAAENKTSRQEIMVDTSDIDHYVRRRIRETGGIITIAELTKETGYSECYLRKIFSGLHGVPPKTFGKFVRFQHALAVIGKGGRTLDQVANECGYYDQSHMNKDFKKFLGCTPESFSREQPRRA